MNIDDAHRQLLIDEAKIEIGLATGGSQNLIFDQAADHFGSDDDAHYMIHTYAQGDMDTSDLLPITIAYLELLQHIIPYCTECDD